MVRVSELDYSADSSSRFESLRARPWAMWLDSGRTHSDDARYDILVADPYLTLTTRGATTEIQSRKGTTTSDRDPLALIEEYLGERAAPISTLPS